MKKVTNQRKMTKGKNILVKFFTALVLILILSTALATLQLKIEKKKMSANSEKEHNVTPWTYERLSKLTYEYDQNLFEVRNDSFNISKRGTSVPTIVFKDKKRERDILTIVDLDRIENNFTDLEDITYMSGAERRTTLREVSFFGNQSNFMSEIFGDGGGADPTGCSQGSGVITDSLYRYEVKLAVIVNTDYSEVSCKGKEPEITYNPDAQTVESVLKTVESIRFDYN